MSTSMEPLRDSQWFLSFISSFENPIMGGTGWRYLYGDYTVFFCIHWYFAGIGSQRRRWRERRAQRRALPGFGGPISAPALRRYWPAPTAIPWPNVRL